MTGSARPVAVELTESPRTAISANGWHQGAIARLSDLELASDCDLGVIVTHDCDLVNDSFSKEPVVEVLPIKLDGKKPGKQKRLTTRTPRELALEVTSPAGVQWGTVAIKERTCADRAKLLTAKPDAHHRIERRSIAELTEWLARRYVRPAFPDAFVHAIQTTYDSAGVSVERRIDALLSGPNTEHVRRLYLAVEESRENPEDLFVSVVALMEGKDGEDSIRTLVQDSFVAPIAELLLSVRGVFVGQMEALFGDQMTVELLENLVQYTPDALSL